MQSRPGYCSLLRWRDWPGCGSNRRCVKGWDVAPDHLRGDGCHRCIARPVETFRRLLSLCLTACLIALLYVVHFGKPFYLLRLMVICIPMNRKHRLWLAYACSSQITSKPARPSCTT